MLGGRMTAQDEDEVEDELAALEAEMGGAKMPAVPDTELPERERPAQAAQVEEPAEEQPARTPMLAS